ncbi:MAG: hypothetical protein ACK559_11980, partial [bacterium]
MVQARGVRTEAHVRGVVPDGDLEHLRDPIAGAPAAPDARRDELIRGRVRGATATEPCAELEVGDRVHGNGHAARGALVEQRPLGRERDRTSDEDVLSNRQGPEPNRPHRAAEDR